MGLLKGENGVKLSLRREFEGAFGRYQSFEKCFEEMEQPAEDVVICIDGNVLMMSLPEKINREGDDTLPARKEYLTLKDTIEIVIRKLHAFFRAACCVIVVFDQPETLTLAKGREQKARDKDKSQGTDDYTLRMMKLADPLKDLACGRNARPRYSDEVFREVRRSMSRFLRKTGKVLVVDGADERGALRHTGSLRLPRVVAEGDDNVAVARWMCNYTHSGEGDLKLRLIYGRVLAAHGNDDAPQILQRVKIYSTWTTDTDDYGVELIGAAQRDCEDRLDPPVKFWTTMHEPSTINSRIYDNGFASLSLCEVDVLYRLILERIFGERWKSISRRTTATHRRELISLLVSAWMMMGCDYVNMIKLLSFKGSLAAVAGYANRKSLADLKHAWAPDSRPNVRLLTRAAIRKVVVADARSRNANFDGTLSEDANASITRASWMLAYWSGIEYTDELADFNMVIDPVAVAKRAAERERRAKVRGCLVFAVLAFLALLHRVRNRGIPCRRSPRRITAVGNGGEASTAPVVRKKRRQMSCPVGNGYN